MTRAPRARPAILLLALALVVAACGGTAPSAVPSPSVAPSAPPATASPAATSPAPTPTPASTVADEAEVAALLDAARASVAAGTVRIDYSVEFAGSTAIPDGVFLTGEGQASFARPRQAWLSADLRNAGFGDWEMILDDRLLYVRGDIVAQAVPAGTWLLVDLDSEHRSVDDFAEIASGQNDTSLALFYILGATDDVRVAAGEAIRGVGTRRFEVEIDLERARERVPEESAAALDENIAALLEGGIGSVLEAEIWVGDDGRVLRARYVYTLGAAQGRGTMIGAYEFSDFGAAMELGTPAEADVVRLEDAVER